MTDDKGNIELPPLPQPLYQQTYTGKQMLDYTYAAILADRERSAKVDAKPQVHEARLSLADNGDWSVGGDHRPGRINIRIRWTADGRAWIESEANRELARKLRVVAEVGYTAPTDAALRDAADALDGGER